MSLTEEISADAYRTAAETNTLRMRLTAVATPSWLHADGSTGGGPPESRGGRKLSAMTDIVLSCHPKPFLQRK